ncbi:sorbitol dehydrogenase-like [Brevipalpus obovatus]|uniref:sorbitol dehydrogenase-like n=1 Tax=Brevipalpus obovatus TaxID=246614 RepID=UPI003D9FA5D9
MVKRSLCFANKGELRVDTYTKDAEMKDDEVMIKVAYCGICGSDIHWLTQGNLGHVPMKAGEVYGHESSGTITKVGDKVKNFNVGDRVCIEPSIPCFSYGCEPCQIGANNCCIGADTGGITSGRQGFFRSTNCWPANMCHKLPENMSLEDGALVEPTACAVWSVKRSRLQGGDKTLVIGCGPIGLLCMMVAKAYGAGKIVATDINPKRLELATKAGADHALLTTREDTSENISMKVSKLLGQAPHLTLECTGTAAAINTGIVATRRGGRVGLVGLGSTKVPVDLSMASLRELELIGANRYNNTFNEAIELISSGKIDTKLVISDIIDLQEAQKAFDKLKAGDGVKILLKCSDN